MCSMREVVHLVCGRLVDSKSRHCDGQRHGTAARGEGRENEARVVDGLDSE